MALVREFREASTGLTSTVGGTAANPNAGPNNWVAQVSNFTRQSGGGMKGDNSGGYNILSIEASAPLKKFIIQIDAPATAKASGWTDQCVVLFGETAYGASVRYKASLFEGGSFQFARFIREGTGAGAAELLLDQSSLNTAVGWTWTVEQTSATTFVTTVTDGTTTVGGAGPGTWTDNGDTGYPSGNVVEFYQRSSQYTLLSFDAYIEGASSAAPFLTGAKYVASRTSQHHYYGG